jgi:hypothetical protein
MRLFIEFDLDDGVKINYAKFETVLMKLWKTKLSS